MKYWLKIDSAPKDGSAVLVNDTTHTTKWCVANFAISDEGGMWVYNDPFHNDLNPLGPNPSHWMPVEDVPTE